MKGTIVLAAVVAIIAIAGQAFAHDYSPEQKARYYFERIDTNNDGIISRAEHDDFADAMFEAADTNHDNVLTLDEVIAAKKHEMAEYKAMRHDEGGILSSTTSRKGSPNIRLPNRTNTNPVDHSYNSTNPSQDDR